MIFGIGISLSLPPLSQYIHSLSLTFSLWSFLFTMRAVICWSMKRRIVARTANGMAMNGAQEGRPLPVATVKNRERRERGKYSLVLHTQR